MQAKTQEAGEKQLAPLQAICAEYMHFSHMESLPNSEPWCTDHP